MRVILKLRCHRAWAKRVTSATSSRGYARNFLIPQELALPHTPRNVRAIERRAAEIDLRKKQKRHDAASLKERLEGELLVFEVAAGETGKLFGSISNANIATELEKRGYDIERRRIDVPSHSLRTTGEHNAGRAPLRPRGGDALDPH